MGRFLPQRVMLVYDEGARLRGMQPNRRIPSLKGCVSGTFLLCGLSEEEGFCSLTPACQSEFQRCFADSGEFMLLGADGVCASYAEFTRAVGKLWDRWWTVNPLC